MDLVLLLFPSVVWPPLSLFVLDRAHHPTPSCFVAFFYPPSHLRLVRPAVAVWYLHIDAALRAVLVRVNRATLLPRYHDFSPLLARFLLFVVTLTSSPASDHVSRSHTLPSLLLAGFCRLESRRECGGGGEAPSCCSVEFFLSVFLSFLGRGEPRFYESGWSWCLSVGSLSGDTPSRVNPGFER